MWKKPTMLMLAGLALVAGFALTVWAGDKENEKAVTMDQVPAEVKATILKEAGSAEIKELESKTRDGQTVYEAEWVANGKEMEIAVAADGKVLNKKIEKEKEEIAIDKVPAKAREALEKFAGKNKIEKVEGEKEDGIESFEAEWMAEGQKVEVEVTADGVLMETEEHMKAADVPASVQKAAAKHFPAGAELTFVKKTVVIYAAKAQVDGKKKKVEIAPTGKLMMHHHECESHEAGK